MTMNVFQRPAVLASLMAAVLVATACGDGGDSGEDNPNNATNSNTSTSNTTAGSSTTGGTTGSTTGTTGNGTTGATTGGATGTTPECVEDALSPNHVANGAQAVDVGQLYDELQICPGVNDFFSLTLAEGELVLIDILFSHDEGDLDLYVYTQNDNTPFSSSESIDDNEQILLMAPTAGTYTIEVRGFQSAAAPYQLLLTPGCFVDAECPDGLLCDRAETVCFAYEEPSCGSDGELDPNGTDSQAVEVILTEGEASYTGLGACPQDQDQFQVTLDDGDSLVATVSNYTTLVGLFVLDSSGSLVASSADEGFSSQTINLPHLTAGAYIALALHFADNNMATSYDLELQVVAGGCAAPEDCADAPGRPFCDAGVCGGIDGNGTVELGGACDDTADCTMTADFCYNVTASSAGFLCSLECREDSNCSGLGEEAYCGVDGACRLPCSNDGMCTPTERCDDTGRCASIICFADAECVEEENAVCLLSGQGFEGLCGTPEDVPTCGQGGMGEPNNTDTVATPLMLTDGSLTLADQEVCDDDIDLYRITLDAVSTLRVDINYTGPADLDLYIVAAGADSPIGLGLSTELTSETAIAEYAPPGEYVIRVGFYSGEDPTETYSMTLSTESVMCEEGMFCAAQTSVLRLVCEEGACVGFEGNGEVALGETCDSNDDCVADADLCYNAEGAALSGSNICTLRCFVPGDCAAVEGTTCLTDGTFEDGFCLPDPM